MSPDELHNRTIDIIANGLLAAGCEVAVYRNAGRIIASRPNGSTVSVGVKARHDERAVKKAG